MQNGPKTIMSARQPRPAASFAAARSGGHRVPPAPNRRALKTRKETMSGIWRSLVLKPKSATRSGQRTTTSTPNIISDRCARTQKGRKRLCCDVSFPKIPSGLDSPREAESSHDLRRCLQSCTRSERCSSICSSREAGLKSRIYFSASSSTLLCVGRRLVFDCAAVTARCSPG